MELKICEMLRNKNKLDLFCKSTSIDYLYRMITRCYLEITTVVPCCLDHNGDMPLGDLYEQTMDDILSSPRTKALNQGFTGHTAIEPLCQCCGYAAVSKQFRK